MLFAQSNHKSTKRYLHKIKITLLFAQHNPKGAKCYLHKVITKAQNVICTS